MKNIKEYVKAEDIEFSLAKTPQITFEVTDACNLKCTYCGYGEFYSDYDKHRINGGRVGKGISAQASLSLR